MKYVTIIVAGVLAALALGITPQTAEAQEHDLTFRVRNYDKYAVEVRFFSQSERRPHWTWPGGDKAYVLRDSAIHDIKLRCYHNEKICYGAWIEGNRRRYWGLGSSGKEGCQECCWRCDNERTQVINLRP